MTSVHGVQSWHKVGVGVVLCLGGPEVVLGLGPLAPIRLLHAQASAADSSIFQPMTPHRAGMPQRIIGRIASGSGAAA